MNTLAILVGGGPAPGINAVIAAATIEARNHGLRVLGCYDGFKWLVQGDIAHVVELDINDLSRIHYEGGSILRTSRTNPTQTQDGIRYVAETLQRLGVDHLITIGGDDTCFSAAKLARTMPGLTLAHVPKTIDNDLPLPGDVVTFGFTTAVNLGKELVHNLMTDAATTERWFFVTVMGRHAGHLTLGIGGSAQRHRRGVPRRTGEPRSRGRHSRGCDPQAARAWTRSRRGAAGRRHRRKARSLHAR
jgi:6-phosphofructokinase 1